MFYKNKKNLLARYKIIRTGTKCSVTHKKEKKRALHVYLNSHVFSLLDINPTVTTGLPCRPHSPANCSGNGHLTYYPHG